MRLSFFKRKEKVLKEAFFLSFLLLLLLSARTRDLAAFYCTDVDLDGMCWRRGGGD